MIGAKSKAIFQTVLILGLKLSILVMTVTMKNTMAMTMTNQGLD